MIKYLKTIDIPQSVHKYEEDILPDYTSLSASKEYTLPKITTPITSKDYTTTSGLATIQRPTAPKQSKRYTDRDEFVSDLYAAYSSALNAKGLDPSYAYMLVAQDALESAYGSKYSGNYNYGNITAIGDQPYTMGNDKDGLGNTISRKFRNYNSLDEWVNAKIDLLNGKRYNAFTGDPNQFYDRVKAGGYAEDPNYVKKLTDTYKVIKAGRGTGLPQVFGKAINAVGKITSRPASLIMEELYSGIDPETLTPQHIGFIQQDFNYTPPIISKSVWESFLERPTREQDDIVRMWWGEKYSSFKSLSQYPKDLNKFKTWVETYANNK